MQTSPFDFVSALSAEELCPVCKELHAAVDECFCSSCLTHVCRDCSSLQPDTTWICTSCEALLPPRAFPVPVRSRGDRLQHARHVVREQAALAVREAGPRARQAAAVARLRVAGAIAIMSAAWVAFLVRAKPWLSTRAEQTRVLATAASAWTSRESARAGQHAQRALHGALHFARTFPARQHTFSLLIAMTILLAVARNENSDAS